MEKIVEFNQYQKATSGDLSNQGTYARSSLDHVVGDGIVGGTRGFTGFNTVKSAQTQVTTATGRLYNTDGSVYFRDDAGGIVTDFLTVLPAVANRYATIVVAGNNPVDTNTQSREFLIDVVARTTQAKATPTESWRHATVTYVLGAESAAPQPPALDAQYLGIANVLLSPTGVISVTMLTANILPSVRDAYTLANQDALSIAALQPRLQTLESDISQITNSIGNCARKDYTLRMAGDVANLKEIAGLPASYADYGTDVFLDTSMSDLTHASYAAQVMDGLRFPTAATATSTLSLLNPLDAGVTQNNGLILPAYTEYRWRQVDPNNGELALNQFAYAPASMTVANMSNIRQRFGSYFTVTASSSWWLSVSQYDPVTGNLTQNGQTFQAIPTGDRDPNGSLIFRVTQTWRDAVATPYWTRTSSTQTTSGFPWVQTFLQSQTVWCTSVGVPFNRLDTSGPVTFGLCEVHADGTPDFGKVLALTTVPVSGLWLNVRDPNPFRRYPIQPTLLQAGKRYGVIVMTAGNHWVNISDAGGSVNGMLFYQNNSGYWQADPAHAFVIDLGIAGFTNTRTEVVFNNNALTLAGGISSLDLLYQGVVPDSTTLTWSVNVNGVWQAFDPSKQSPLYGLPAQIGLKATFVGTNGIQPGMILPGSQVIISRPALALSHFSKPYTLAAPTTSVQVTAQIENWDSAHHTAALGLIVGSTSYTPSVTTDRTIGTGIIQRTSHFTVPSTSTIVPTIAGTATDVNNLYSVSERTHVSS